MTEEEIKVKIKLELLELKSDEFEKRIKTLEEDVKMFCSGISLQKRKVKDVVSGLLWELGYELIGENIILRKKKEKN